MKNVYLVGIGGIGMSALARYYKHAGAFTAGYDLTPSPLTDHLQEEGIPVHFTDSVSQIPQAITEAPEDTLVIYTPAVPKDHQELAFFNSHGYTVIKRSAALGHIARNHQTLAVSGTHGKTTTSTLLAHILHHSGMGCTAFLGGISKNYHSNLLLSKGPTLVAEADEFDRSFHQLFPQEALITAADADHLDIYGTHEAVKEAFVQFASQITPGGFLVVKKGVDLPFRLAAGVTLYRYAAQEPCDFYAANLRVEDGGFYTFDLYHNGTWLRDCKLGIPGQVNVENAVGASALALLYGVPPQAVREALASFQGVERRMDVRYLSQTCCYIDDYAHHPAELKATILSVRAFFPHRPITGIFQPHLFTRTRDFAPEFAESLSLLDNVVLLPIYPAREQPIAGVRSEIILDRITAPHKQILTPEEVLPYLTTTRPSVLLTLGAGNIDRLVPQIAHLLEEQHA